MIRCTSAFAPGRYHHFKNCEDRASTYAENGCWAMMVCDGCGSASLAAPAAEFQTSLLPQLLPWFEHLWRDYPEANTPVKRYYRAWLQKQLWDFSIVQQMDFRQLSATMVVFMVSQGRWITLHIGDGAVFGILSGDGSVVTLSEPDHNPQNPSETTFLNYCTQQQFRVHKGLTDRLEGVVLSSDGLSDVLKLCPDLTKGLLCTAYDPDGLEEVILTLSRDPVFTSDDVSLAVGAFVRRDFRDTADLDEEQRHLLNQVAEGFSPVATACGSARKQRTRQLLVQLQQAGFLSRDQFGRWQVCDFG